MGEKGQKVWCDKAVEKKIKKLKKEKKKGSNVVNPPEIDENIAVGVKVFTGPTFLF